MHTQSNTETGRQPAIKPNPVIRRFQSPIDPLQFDNGYLDGLAAFQTHGRWATIKQSKSSNAYALGLWRGYADGLYGIPRTFSFPSVEGYNQVVSELRGEIEPLIASRISLVDFTEGYLYGMGLKKRYPQQELEDNECAFEMGKRKAAHDIYRNIDNSQCIVRAYNEAEYQARRLNLTRYGWRSRTPLRTIESESLGLDTFELTPEAAAWTWIWEEETTASPAWHGGVA